MAKKASRKKKPFTKDEMMSWLADDLGSDFTGLLGPREDIVGAVMDETGVSPEDVESAIDALLAEGSQLCMTELACSDDEDE